MDNAHKIVKALEEFGFVSLGLKTDDFVEEGKIIQLGYEPVRVDIITSIEGFTFQEVWKNKKKGAYGEEDVYFIGLKELIKNKKLTNRVQDKIDLKFLRKIKK